MHEDIPSWKTILYLQQKRIFLLRCDKSNVLLPSNHQQRIDFDLLLIQQSRRIATSIKDIDAKISSLHLDWINLTRNTKNYLKFTVFTYKQQFIKKFNWLQKKQFTEILNLQNKNRKKLKTAKYA